MELRSMNPRRLVELGSSGTSTHKTVISPIYSETFLSHDASRSCACESDLNSTGAVEPMPQVEII